MSSKELIALQKLWYRKLKDLGFGDIEVMDHEGEMDSPMMERTASSLSARFDPSVEEYYRLARLYLFDGKFTSDLDKFIWGLHSDGTAYRDIVLALPAAGFYPYKLFFIQKQLRRIQACMHDFYNVNAKRSKSQMGLFNE